MKQECSRSKKSLNSSLASSSHCEPTSLGTYFKVFLSLCLVLLISNLLVTTANCMPSHEIPFYDTPDEETVKLFMDRALNTYVKTVSKRKSTCLTDETLNVCKRCAKATKVPSTEHFCCDNVRSTYDWCQKILNFKLVVEANTGIRRKNNRMS